MICLGMVLSFGLSAHGADGNKLFLKNCAPCHGPDGKARTPAARKLGVKDLTKSTTTDAQIRLSIIEGRLDQRGIRKMPSFKDKLSPEEIEAVVRWVKTFR